MTHKFDARQSWKPMLKLETRTRMTKLETNARHQGARWKFDGLWTFYTLKFEALYNDIQTYDVLDPYADRIWSIKTSKMAIALWRVRWSKMNMHFQPPNR